ncbi:NUDIX domain-containing protein [Microbacterium thalassium]|uniref:Putative NUDIX family NTP pyrophosphohydrolase n=1 Tax=Microbacterium thalassium TaxID=362649 RepID=A0A7X0KU55_9MICO|nr:NUDIX domain-containing protein [Microbacterium thalassium]MBB6390784.1 putative NUDIX family NTP pyrophosphohydrolase [Microbacterium thalassium]GLK25892.1 DNA mismatch repair protein MutT [Microbacterium thalassium]
MATTSAGILLYRLEPSVQVLIAHMGGPFWAAKDAGAWSIPKGEYDADAEAALDAAKREFREELGIDPPDGPFAELGTFAYSSGKRVTVFVADGAGIDLDGVAFGEFELEWPPRSGRTARFPEVDRVEWMEPDAARGRLVTGQRPALDALVGRLAAAR